jgi:hypothetical protein
MGGPSEGSTAPEEPCRALAAPVHRGGIDATYRKGLLRRKVARTLYLVSRR